MRKNDGLLFYRCDIRDLKWKLNVWVVCDYTSLIWYRLNQLVNDETFFLQCQTYNALVLATESSVCIYGEILKLPEGKTVSSFIQLKEKRSVALFILVHVIYMNKTLSMDEESDSTI